jgi:polyisoprenoid-binding protein YceI
MSPLHEVSFHGTSFETTSDPPERWEVDQAASALDFTLRHLVISQIRGRFYRWGGTLFLDRQQPSRSSVEVWVDLDSIDTGAPERDAHVRSAEFLNVAQYPRAFFKSTAVEMSDEQIILHGLLDLHGIVHDVDLNVTIGATSKDRHGALRSRYAVRGSIDRQSFALHWNQDLDIGGVVVGDQIELAANVEVVRAQDNGNPRRR